MTFMLAPRIKGIEGLDPPTPPIEDTSFLVGRLDCKRMRTVDSGMHGTPHSFSSELELTSLCTIRASHLVVHD